MCEADAAEVEVLHRWDCADFPEGDNVEQELGFVFEEDADVFHGLDAEGQVPVGDLVRD